MPTIDKDTKIFLPKEYHFINNICSYLYDQLTEVFADETYSDMSSTTIDFDSDDHNLKLATELSNEHPFDILAKFGHLSDIIAQNWTDFSDLIPTEHLLRQRFEELEKARNYIAHTRLYSLLNLEELNNTSMIAVNRWDLITSHFIDFLIFSFL